MRHSHSRFQRRYVHLCVCLSAAAALAAVAYAQPRDADHNHPTIPVGVASVDITPDRPIRLSGYSSRQTPSDGVAQRLNAKALAIGRDASVSVLVTLDAIGVPDWVSKELSERLYRKASIPRESLVIAASHTHAAPAMHGNLPFMFVSALTPEEQNEIKRYTHETLDKLEQVALDAIGARSPSRLAWTKGTVDFARNRRVIENGTWTGFGTQPDGPVDHSLPMLAVFGTDGALRSVFANYACHCTTLGGQYNQVHGDWAGVSQAEIERRHPGSIALIAIGCGADQNPNPRGDVENAVAHGLAIADEVDRLLSENDFRDLSAAPKGVYREIGLPLEEAPTRAELEAMLAESRRGGHFPRAMLEKLDRGETLESSVAYPVQSWTFGDDLAMVFLAGEVVVDYAIRFYREFDADRLWINAYCNDVPCYIPSKRLYSEGGYEVDQSMVYYGKPARLSVDTEDRVAGEVMKQLPRSFLSDSIRTLLPDPVDKDAALNTIRVRDGLDVQLVAAEPLIRDPIDIVWGPEGKLWVVEMADYPEGIEGKPGGRVRYLEDLDNDGDYDQSTLFLDGLHYPNSIMPWRDGLLVATATEVFLASDSDGDGRAEQKEVILRGFESGNPQHQLAGLQWGLDNWVHVANDFSKGAITSVKTGETIDLGTRDLRFRPDTGEMDPQSGRTQYGLVRDDWGNWFGCSNSYPWWHYALADHYLRRNPYVAYPSPKELLGDEKRAARVYPASHTPSRFNDYDAANRFTSACSVTPYRDRLLGNLARRSLFVAEPVHNLVSRLVIDPMESSFQGRRAASEQSSEFFTSTDNWSRPTSIRTGPDGALYIVDMYRQVIEHPEWIPERQQWRYNLRSGSDKGRIYRVAPEKSPPMAARNFRALSNEELADALETRNGPQRDLAHQELVWRGATMVAPRLARLYEDADEPEIRIQILAVLDGLDALDESIILTALTDTHPGPRRHAIRLSEPYVENGSVALITALQAMASDPDPFVRKQLAYSLGESTSDAATATLAALMGSANEDVYLQAAILSSALPHHAKLAGYLDGHWFNLPERLLKGYIQTSIGAGSPASISNLLQRFAGLQPETAEERRGQLEMLAYSLTELGKRDSSLDRLRRTEDLSLVDALIGSAKIAASNPNATIEARLAAIGFLGLDLEEQEGDAETLIGLLDARVPLDIQQAAIRKCITLGDRNLASRLLSHWPSLGASVRSAAMQGFVSRTSWTEILLSEIAKNSTLARSLSPSQRAALLNHPDDGIQKTSKALLASDVDSAGQTSLEKFRASLELDGEYRDGANRFQELCATCHRIGGEGFHVGPDLTALTNKSREALLQAIINPNLAIEDAYAMHVAETKDGRSIAGIIASETATSITLLNAGGLSETVLRKELEGLANTGASLMPAGLEAALDPQSMADLLVYLQNAGETNPVVLQADGSLRLAAEEGLVSGPSAQLDPNTGALSWIGNDDFVEWRIAALPAGRYIVFFYSGLETATEPLPSQFELSFGPQTMHGAVSNTASLNRMRKREYGEITIADDLEDAAIRFRHRLGEGHVSIREIAIIPVR